MSPIWGNIIYLVPAIEDIVSLGELNMSNGMCFTISLPENSFILSGSYIYSDYQDVKSNSLVRGTIALSLESGKHLILIENGTLTISQKDNIYTFEYSGVDSAGIEIKYSYTGTVSNLDY